MLLDDSTPLVEKRERSSDDDDDRNVDEEEAAIQRSVTNISTSLDQSPAPKQIPVRLPSSYKALRPLSLFMKEHLTGGSGDPKLLKIVSTNWKSLSEDEKQNYSERAKKICDELRDNFEKLTNRQKKDLWDKHAEKMNNRMKRKLNKFYAETNRPKLPSRSYMVFVKECFEKQTKPIKTKVEQNKFVAEMAQQWRQMPDAEKRPYVDQAQCNFSAYHKEMAEWKRKYANEIRAWKEAEAKAAQKARDTQFYQAPSEWNLDDDRDVLVDEREHIQQMLLDDSTHLVEERELSSDDDRDEEAIQRMFLAISTYLGRKEISQNQRIEY
uniref:HMG box domain-containing protein n=1 Tax=Globodera pallida TaxID=36090 RepID=A0A183CPI8_GLOPA